MMTEAPKTAPRIRRPGRTAPAHQSICDSASYFSDPAKIEAH